MKIIASTCIILMSLNANAGWNGLTHHSRANCAGFNETVSWWKGNPVWSRVVSHHYPHGKSKPSLEYHAIDTGKNFSWRHAAYHATESYGGDYMVAGYHYMYKNGQEIMVQFDREIDCNIYDGWWDD